MKLLFVGEGPHDVGHDPSQQDVFAAGGVIPALVRRAGVPVGADSKATWWRRLTRFSKRGLEGKAKAALLIAERRHGCQGVVLVVDNDAKDDEHRLESLERGAVDASVPVACGLAVQSIEAWTLGAPTAIAEELGLTTEEVRELYPSRPVEELHENSGKEELRPKTLLQRLVSQVHRNDSAEFRQAVAERTSVAELEASCPRGFKPFVQELKSRLGGGA
jgi:hypothetical protein